MEATSFCGGVRQKKYSVQQETAPENLIGTRALANRRSKYRK